MQKIVIDYDVNSHDCSRTVIHCLEYESVESLISAFEEKLNNYLKLLENFKKQWNTWHTEYEKLFFVYSQAISSLESWFNSRNF